MRIEEGGGLEPIQIGRALVDAASEMQADDIVMLDISEIAVFADYFVILSAGTDRQIRGLRDDMVKKLKGLGVLLNHLEGIPESGWLLLDFGDVIVHIFETEKRAHYGLEQLWHEAPQVIRVL